MRAMTVLVAATAMACASGTSAQELVHWGAPATATHGQYSYFPMGTPLKLMTRTALSTRTSRPGDRFYLTVAEPLVYRGQVVLPAGSLAAGEVMQAEPSAVLGKRGTLAVRLLYVQTPGGPIKLAGRADRAGKGQGVLAIGGAAVIAWPMAFIHGTSARLPADSVVDAMLAEDLRFPVVAAAAPNGAAVALARP